MDQHRPAISVIVPVYNTERYLRECIESVLAQTFTDFEIILIDDGSTDSSPHICDEYTHIDGRVRAFHQVNGGVTAARSVGVEESHGGFLCFIDADDTISHTFLSELLSFFTTDDIDVVVSEPHMQQEIISPSEWINRLLLNTCFWGQPLKMYRKRIINENVFSCPKKINIAEDLYANLIVAQNVKGYIRVIGEAGYKYRYNPQSVTHLRSFSLEYEEMLMGELEKILPERIINSHEYWRFMLLTWKNLVLNKVFVSHDRPWIREIYKRQKDGMHPITWSDRILLYTPNSYYAYITLTLLKKVKKVLYPIIGKEVGIL